MYCVGVVHYKLNSQEIERFTFHMVNSQTKIITASASASSRPIIISYSFFCREQMRRLKNNNFVFFFVGVMECGVYGDEGDIHHRAASPKLNVGRKREKWN